MKTFITTARIPDGFNWFIHEGKPFVGKPENIDFGRSVPEKGIKIEAIFHYEELPKINSIKQIEILRCYPTAEQEVELLRRYYVGRVSCKIGDLEVELLNRQLVAKAHKFASLKDVITPEFSIKPNCQLFQMTHEINVDSVRRNPLIPEFRLVHKGKPVGYLNESGKRLRDVLDKIVDDIWEMAPEVRATLNLGKWQLQ